MAGIYIHIPFCRKLCYYCDFHFTVSLKQKDRVIHAIEKELILRSDELAGVKIETIYLGGGTPTILEDKEIVSLLNIIHEHYDVIKHAEYTIEANPDDLGEDYLRLLKENTPVNRFSIGTQSFHDEDLTLMNRRHNAEEAYKSIQRAHAVGFHNLNIDLIYGVPGMNDERWKQNLEIFASLDIPHLSAYHLTFEPRTVFSHFRKKGKFKPVDEDLSLRQFEFLLGFLEARGFEHYEISNFAKPGFYSKHNLSYWTGKPYLGVGPSAHSFTGKSRRWNIANNTKYCEALESDSEDYFDTEDIDHITAYNEYVLTALRTKWGVDTELIAQRFGEQVLDTFIAMAGKFADQNTLIKMRNSYVLSDKGKFIADHVISELMITE